MKTTHKITIGVETTTEKKIVTVSVKIKKFLHYKTIEREIIERNIDYPYPLSGLHTFVMSAMNKEIHNIVEIYQNKYKVEDKNIEVIENC